MRRIVLSFLLLATFGATFAMAANRVGTELKVSVNDTLRNRYPVAALDGQGNALVVWANTRLGVIARRVSLNTPGTGGPEMRLLANTNLPSIPGEGEVLAHKEPALLQEADGNFWIFWVRERAYLKSVPFHETRTVLQQDIRGRRFNKQGQPLGDVVVVGAGAPPFQSKPRAVRTSEGTIVVVWQSDDRVASSTAGDGVFARVLNPAGNPRGPAFRVNQPLPSLAAANAAIAADDDGQVLIAWDAPDASGTGVYSRLYSARGEALGDAERVNTTTASRQEHPAVAHLEDEFLVLWHGATGERFRTRIYGQRLDGNGQHIGGEIEVSHGALEYEYDPAIVATPNGNYFVAWMLWDSSFPRALRGRELAADGSPIGGEINVNTFRMDAQYRSSLAVHPRDGVMAVWEGFWNRRAGISAQRIGLSAAPIADFPIIGICPPPPPCIAPDEGCEYQPIFDANGCLVACGPQICG